MKKPDDRPASAGSARPTSDATFYNRCPQLHDYMTCCSWEDGSARVTSTVMFLLEDGTWKGCLNDRALERSLWRSGASLADVLDCLEAALVTQSNDWRKWQGGAKKKR